MNIIPMSGRGVLAINIFTVRPENQQALLDCIREAGDPNSIPGLESMYLLRSLDGTQVINHMQWVSEDAFNQATSGNPVIADTMKQVMRLVEQAGPNRYEIVPWSD